MAAAAAACTVLGDSGLRLCDESDMLSSTWFHSDEVQELLFYFFFFGLFFFSTLKHALIKNPHSASATAAINMLD